MTRKQLRTLRNSRAAGTGNRLSAAFAITEQSQMDCVRGTRFTAAYVCDMVHGRFQNITIDNAREFSGFFGCSIEDLFPASEEAA